MNYSMFISIWVVINTLFQHFRLGLEGRISDLVSNHLTALFELWEQTGFTREDRDERMTVVERQVDQTLTEMIDEEKKNFDELLKVHNYIISRSYFLILYNFTFKKLGTCTYEICDFQL